ncbi:MAG: helix-turn-helix domain-containing protein [Desulfovibrio sp.]|uniref:helix-turn-helix domain-containing protein n=1 Tax=Desulfovibrio sp. 7SRBS1 TaxID=3378064 RepID=UPI003B3C6502
MLFLSLILSVVVSVGVHEENCDNTSMSIGKRIRLLRGDLSQAVFSEKVGIPKNTLGRYERGEITPGGDAIVLLCSKLAVDPNWLLLGRGPTPYDESISQDVEGEPTVTGGSCTRCEKLERELAQERSERRELSKELRTVNAENRTLWKENGVLREQLAEAKARAAPSDATLNNAQTA